MASDGQHPNSRKNLKPYEAGDKWKGNPKGPGKAHVQFWRYVCLYLEMTPTQIKKIDKNKLTLAQRGALKTALQIADGDKVMIKEAIDRDIGKVAQGLEVSGLDVVKYYGKGIDPDKV